MQQQQTVKCTLPRSQLKEQRSLKVMKILNPQEGGCRGRRIEKSPPHEWGNWSDFGNRSSVSISTIAHLILLRHFPDFICFLYSSLQTETRVSPLIWVSVLWCFELLGASFWALRLCLPIGTLINREKMKTSPCQKPTSTSSSPVWSQSLAGLVLLVGYLLLISLFGLKAKLLRGPEGLIDTFQPLLIWMRPRLLTHWVWGQTSLNQFFLLLEFFSSCCPKHHPNKHWLLPK